MVCRHLARSNRVAPTRTSEWTKTDITRVRAGVAGPPPPVDPGATTRADRLRRRRLTLLPRGPPGAAPSDAPARISPANPAKRGPAKRELPGPWPKER